MSVKLLTNKEFLKRMGELRYWILQSVEPLEDSQEARQERIARGEKDKIFFARTYFPHYLEDEFADFHPKMFQCGDILNIPVIVYGSRGCAKSVILSLIDVIHKIVYGQRWFFLFISTSEDAAMEYTGPIKEELEINPRLRQDFGDLVQRGNWEHNDFRTSNGRRVLALGRRGSAKGKRNGPHRPDHIICEDIDDRNKSMSLKVVKHTLNWLKTDVLKAVNPKRWSFLYIGNYYSKRTIIHALMQNEYYVIRKFILEENGRSRWRSRFPMSVLRTMKKLDGSLVYDMEILNIPRDDEDQTFQEEWITYYQPEEIAGVSLRKFAYCDPSAKQKEIHDYKAYIIIGFAPTGIIYVLHAWIKRRSKWQMIKAGYDLYRLLQYEMLGIEDTAFQATLAEDFDKQAEDEGFPLPFRLVPVRLAKEVRIARRSSLVERGMIRFRKDHSDQNLLVEQLLSFPEGHDDGPDALDGAIEIGERLQGGVKYESVEKRTGMLGHFKGIFG